MDIPGLDFASAYPYLEAGYLIGREGWRTAPDAPLSKYLKMMGGIVYIGTEGAWDVVTSKTGAEEANFSLSDYLAEDYIAFGVSEQINPYAALTLVI